MTQWLNHSFRRMGDAGYQSSLARWWSGLKQSAARRVYAAFPGLALASLEIDAARLMKTPGRVVLEIPRLFSTHLREIDPSLNDDLLDLYGRSEQMLSNHFSFFNRSHQFETEIDWRIGESRAWVGELHAFDYALDVALTYRISGEERYTRHLRHIIAHWIADNPPLQGPGWLPGPLARRVRNWILTTDLARADWERDPEFLRVLSHSLALQSAQLFRQPNRTADDSRTASTRSCSFVLDRARAFVLAGKFFGARGDRCSAAALEAILECGKANIQAGPAFHVSLAAGILEYVLFQRERSEDLLAALREVLRVVESLLLPDGSLSLFGTPGRDDLADVAALAAVLFEDATWKSISGRFGIWPYMLLGEEGQVGFGALPDKRWRSENRLLPRAGFYRLAGADSSALVINGQDSRSPGAHADHLSFELSIQGQRVIVDSGAYVPADEPEAKPFTAAHAHNVFLLDDHIPSADTLTPEPARPQEWLLGPEFIGLRWPEYRPAATGLSYSRAWYCLGGRFWAVLDTVRGDGTACGASLLHFYPTFELELLNDRVIARSRVLAVTVVPFGSSIPQMMISRGDHPEYPGWYAPAPGIKYPASVLAFGWANVAPPWMGGYVIAPGTEADFRAGVLDREAGTMSLEIRGRRYGLPL